MDRHFVTIMCLVAIALNALPGCMLRRPGAHIREDLAHLRQLASQTQYDDVHKPDPPSPAMQSGPPRLLTDLDPADFWPMTPEEAVQLAISNSPVLRDLGGTVLRAPETIRTLQNPALQETDPRTGVPAALAFFDANLATRMFFEKNDRAVNNRIVGLGTQIFQQDLLNWESELSKRSMTGGQYTFRKSWQYDANNSTDNFFPSAWGVLMDFEVRQPLLQGAGVGFNQVAGPEAVPGEINGVRIARLNTDISIAEYRIALRNLVSNVENAYWDLYFAYRDLEAKIAARDEALQTWREFEASAEEGGVGVDAEAQAREQYFRFQEEVQNALSGRLLQGTEINNGSSGGTFRGTLGVLVAERRLRLAMGLPINDGRVIRPAYDPKMVKVVFDWGEVLTEALTRRAELERQRTELRRNRLELIANRNFLLPRLDAFGRYRFRGLGQELIDSPNSTPIMVGPDTIDASFDNAYQNLTTGDFQEWQLGFEFTLPVGFRRAHAAVRHSQLRLARAQAILEEQERHVVYGLSNAYAEVVRAFEVMQTAYNRRIAAKENYEALDERLQFEKDRQANANLLLDAQRRLADSESRYYLAQVDYMLAVKNVHFEKGSLLDYNEVYVMGDDRRIPPEDASSLRKWQRGRPFDYLLTRPRRGGSRGEPAGATQKPGGNVVETTEDGNVIPQDGWPMVRLPQLALPDVQLPSLENLAAPAGPTSPAQVLPPAGPRTASRTSPNVPGPPARHSPAPMSETAAPMSETAPGAEAAAVAAGAADRGEPEEAGNTALQAAVERAAKDADRRAGNRAQDSTSGGRKRPALRLPFRSTHVETAGDEQPSGKSTRATPATAIGPERGGVRVDVADASAAPAASERPSISSGTREPQRKPDYRFPAMPAPGREARSGRWSVEERSSSSKQQGPGERRVAGDQEVAAKDQEVGHRQAASPSAEGPNRLLDDLVRKGATSDSPTDAVTSPLPAAGPAGSPLAVDDRVPPIRAVQAPRFREPSESGSGRSGGTSALVRGDWRPVPTGQRPSQLEPAQANRAPVVRPAPPTRPGPLATARFAPRGGEQVVERRAIPAGSASQLRPAQAAAAPRLPGRPAPGMTAQPAPGMTAQPAPDKRGPADAARETPTPRNSAFRNPALRNPAPATPAPATPAPATPAPATPAPATSAPATSAPATPPGRSSLGNYILASGDTPPPGKPPVNERNQPPLLRMLFGTEQDQQEARTVPASAHSGISRDERAGRHARPAGAPPLFRLPLVVEEPVADAEAHAPFPTVIRPQATPDRVSPATNR